jgi:exopolysaccharide biosynthesis protein
MRKLFQKHYWWAITYSAILAMSAAYTLLDTFVIPKPIKAVPQPVQAISTPVPVAPKPVHASPEAAKARPDIAPPKTATAVVPPKTDTQDAKKAPVPEEKSVAVIPTDTSASTEKPITESVSRTETSYRDANIRIEISTKRFADTQVYIADITLKSLANLKTAIAQNVFGRNITQTTSSLAKSHNALLAINGDFCGYRNEGFVIRNSVLYRKTPRRTGDDGDLVIYQDGSFKVVGESSIKAEALMEKGAVQVFSFGPSLLEGGAVKVGERSEIVGRSSVSNPRTAIGMIGPLHYIFIVSDGRTRSSTGLSLYQLASLLKEQGCQAAYNLDGGGSTTMVFNGKVINYPTDGRRTGERNVSDIVYIGYE